MCAKCGDRTALESSSAHAEMRLSFQRLQCLAPILPCMVRALCAIASARTTARYLCSQFNLRASCSSASMAPKRAREGATAATKPAKSAKAAKAEQAALPAIEDFSPTDLQQVGGHCVAVCQSHSSWQSRVCECVGVERSTIVV